MPSASVWPSPRFLCPAAGDLEKTYGFYRTEILAALANGILLLFVSAYILFEASQRLANPRDVDAAPMLIVACGGWW